MEQKDKLEKKQIKLVWCETKQMSNWGFMSRLKWDDNLSYTLFHTKKDWTDTKAFSALKKLPMSGIGTTVEILYKEEDYVSPRDNKTYKSRKAIGLMEVPWAPTPQTVWNVVDNFNKNNNDTEDDLSASDKDFLDQIPF